MAHFHDFNQLIFPLTRSEKVTLIQQIRFDHCDQSETKVINTGHSPLPRPGSAGFLLKHNFGAFISTNSDKKKSQTTTKLNRSSLNNLDDLNYNVIPQSLWFSKANVAAKQRPPQAEAA